MRNQLVVAVHVIPHEFMLIPDILSSSSSCSALISVYNGSLNAPPVHDYNYILYAVVRST